MRPGMKLRQIDEPYKSTKQLLRLSLIDDTYGQIGRWQTAHTNVMRIKDSERREKLLDKKFESIGDAIMSQIEAGKNSQ